MEKSLCCYVCLLVTLTVVESSLIRGAEREEEPPVNIFVEREPLQLCPIRTEWNTPYQQNGSAVCGDVFEFNRRLKGGGYRKERRHVQNCICPNMVDQTVTCNYSPEYMLRQGKVQEEALCVPTSTLNSCRPGQTARRMHINAEDFNARTFVTIRCTCPRHFAVRLRGRQKATRFSSREFIGYEFGEDHKYECVFPGRRRGRGRRRQRGRGRSRTRRNRRQ